MSKPQKIEYLISLFFNTGRLIQEKTQKEDTVDPISMLQLEALRLIALEKPTMKRIADYFHIKAPSATSLVNGLVKAGRVKRIEHNGDRRVVQMMITKKGELFLKDGLKQMTHHMSQVFSKLTDAQIDNFIQIMEEIKKAYR